MIKLIELTDDKLEQFKIDMKESFRIGYLKETSKNEDILPEKDIIDSLEKKGSYAYMAMKNNEMVGGTIVIINEETGVNHLDFLYVKVEYQGQKIGQNIWKEIEEKYPDTKVWETCTPHFDKRNIHFYINTCGFHAIEYHTKYHPDPSFPNDYKTEIFGGMFRFQKIVSNDFKK